MNTSIIFLLLYLLAWEKKGFLLFIRGRRAVQKRSEKDRAKQGKTGQNRIGQDRQDRTGLEGQEGAGPDKTPRCF